MLLRYIKPFLVHMNTKYLLYMSNVFLHDLLGANYSSLLEFMLYVFILKQNLSLCVYSYVPLLASLGTSH